jgi:pimeloyl-ACP methyl ester carboxylesterase
MLRGFGAGFDGPLATADGTALAHAERLLETITEPSVIVGYDIGSRVAQTLARIAPEFVSGLVLTPAYPGIGDRRHEPRMQEHFWYQHFHRSGLATTLLDGNPDAVRAYLRFVWGAWARDLTILDDPEFEQLVADYSRPGAFAASIEWYNSNRVPAAGESPVDAPTVFLWPSADPLFPPEWADRVGEWFPNGRLEPVDCGHFVPLEAPEVVARAVESLL